MRYILLVVFFLPFQFIQGQNLIVNPGAELDPSTNGWTIASGYWISSVQRPVHGGSYHFYAGNDSGDPAGGGLVPGGINELYQDIDVSAFASSIDASASTFNFTAWMRIYGLSGGVWNDKGKAIVEYRDASSTVLYTYDTGLQNNLSWTSYTNSHLAPVGTRTIRIRLIAIWLAGSESDGYFDDLVLTHTSSSLPITLISFNSVLVDDAVDVKWQTSAEEANDYFTLEKSEDGKTWKNISIQKGSLNSRQLSTYQYFDQELVEGIQYYRLTQTDINGVSSTYPVIAQRIDISDQFNFSIYPNPSNGPVTISTSTSGEKRLRVFSTEGTLLLETSFDVNEYSVDLSDFSAGHYIIEVLTSTSVQRKTLVKF